MKSVIESRVAERVISFREKSERECFVNLLNEAEKTVDSLLLADAMMALSDSLLRLRPEKPLQPPRLPPLDTLPVGPIFKADSAKTDNR